jgi:thiosulfate reductase cytochrome b subunit
MAAASEESRGCDAAAATGRQGEVAMSTVLSADEPQYSGAGHARWIRISHWILAASVLVLAFSGFMILMVHPRLYWGQVGNDLTPALFELPISRNYQHGGWATPVSFFPGESPVVTAVRTYDIFNQNGWARSLHFLAAWFLLVTGLLYLVAGLGSGHLWRDLVPRLRDLSPRRLWQDVVAHLRLPIPAAPGGPPYGLLQKLSYAGVVLVALPLTVLSGLAMAPAVAAACPALQDLFGGSQSARTVHFFAFAALVLFVVVHVVMVVLTGFTRQMRAMTVGD